MNATPHIIIIVIIAIVAIFVTVSFADLLLIPITVGIIITGIITIAAWAVHTKLVTM